VKFKFPRLSDALIALGLFAIVAMGSVALTRAQSSSNVPLGVGAFILIAFITLPLAWRQRAPATVLWISVTAWMLFVAIGYPDAASMLGLIIALYGVGLYLPRRIALAHGVAAIVLVSGWTAVGVSIDDHTPDFAIASTLTALVLALAIGLADNRRHSRITELEVMHARQEQERRGATADAVRAERARIARELHDVVAHEVTVMTLQAEGARRLASGDDPRVAEALKTISDSGRKGLLEMQRMIGVLRASEADAITGAGLAPTGEAAPSHHADNGTFDLMPVPSLAALPDLVQQVEDAGLPVSLEVSGSAHVPAGVELSAFRVVQESLTNAMKHAGPGASATVTVVRQSNAVTVTVEDDGRGVISEAMLSGGHGIGGMRERITSLGGTIDIGPRSGGGYRVHAVLPSGDDQVRATRPRTPTE